MILYCLRRALQPSATETGFISERYQHFRKRDLPCGLHDSLCTLHLFCSFRLTEFRHRRNTQYGWVANPYPTGTFTPQDAPSFAWRAHCASAARPFASAASAWLGHIVNKPTEQHLKAMHYDHYLCYTNDQNATQGSRMLTVLLNPLPRHQKTGHY